MVGYIWWVQATSEREYEAMRSGVDQYELIGTAKRLYRKSIRH